MNENLIGHIHFCEAYPTNFQSKSHISYDLKREIIVNINIIWHFT